MREKMISMLMAVMLLCCLTAPEPVMAKVKEKAYKASETRGMEEGNGCRNIQQLGKTESAFYLWEQKESTGKWNYKFRLYTYFLKGSKLKRRKTIVGKKDNGEQQKVLQKINEFSLGDGCFDSKGKYLYIPDSDFGNKISLYRFSLTKDKVKRINLSKNKYIKSLTKSSGSPNHMKCYYISKNRIGLRIERHEKTYSETISYRVLIYNTKKNRIEKKYDCDFQVEGMSQKYIYGMDMESTSNSAYNHLTRKLCYRRMKKGAKEVQVVIENPEFEYGHLDHPDDEGFLPHRENCNRVTLRGNKLYYITINGLYSYHMQTKKNICILSAKDSKYMKKYLPGYVHAMMVNKKGDIYLLCAWDWYSRFKVIKVRGEVKKRSKKF